MNITIQFNIEDVKVEDEYFRAHGEAVLVSSDHGIGPHEFWGAKGVHVDHRIEVEEFTRFDLFRLHEDGIESRVFDKTLHERVQEKIEETLWEMAREKEAAREPEDFPEV